MLDTNIFVKKHKYLLHGYRMKQYWVYKNYRSPLNFVTVLIYGQIKN